jgi:long-chain acyl-CoA synthetase
MTQVIAAGPYASSPWLAHYDSDVPHSVAGPEETLLDVVRRQAARAPERAAIRFEGAVTSYGTLVAQATAFAAALRELGVRRGDRVALMLPNCPQFIVAELGAWMAGAIVAPVNFTYPDDEIAAMLARTGAEIAVVLSPFYDRTKAIQPATAVRRIVVAFVRDVLPPVKSLLFRLAVEKKQGHRATLRDGDLAMRDLLARHAGAPPLGEAPRPGDAAVLLPSGGTTGTPKWVTGSHGGLATSGAQIHAWLRSAFSEGDTLLLPLPLFHVYALGGVQSLAFSGGYSLTLIANPRDMSGMLRTIRRERPTFIVAVPALLNGIMTHKDAAQSREALANVKLTFSGAAPLLAETKARFEALTGGVVVEGYSLTEAQMAICGNPARGPKKVGSVGMPLPDVHLRIVDIETATRDVPLGESGEVLLSAPQLMIGFWDAPGETADMLRAGPDGRRWLHTGDIGYMDQDGYLFLTDRKKEVIKVSGWQVWPREVEEAVASHPAVLEVGVAAIQHAIKGEVPKAWVVLHQGASAIEEEIREWCRDRVAHYKVPVEVSFVDALPKTAVGKVLRRKLRELP